MSVAPSVPIVTNQRGVDMSSAESKSPVKREVEPAVSPRAWAAREDQRPRESEADVLDPWFRRAIEWVESLPKNVSGSDKSWVFRSLKEGEEHFRRARRQ